MCLGIAIRRPNDVLDKGEHLGFEWMIIHNGMGYRCGYVRLPSGHPWFGLGFDDFNADVHGGLTFSAKDEPCDKGQADDGYWIGFDCAHASDARDFSLPFEGGDECKEMLQRIHRETCQQVYGTEEPSSPFRETIKTTEYVKAECISLCEQAAAQAPCPSPSVRVP